MSTNLPEAASEETRMVLQSLDRLDSRGYDDRWIADYLSGKTGQKVGPEEIRKVDFTLANGDKIGWRSWRWITLKPEVGEE